MMVTCDFCSCIWNLDRANKCPLCNHTNFRKFRGEESELVEFYNKPGVYAKSAPPRIPYFIELLEQMKAIHIKKNKDYASEKNPFENFERSAELMNWFNDPIDKSFINLIGTKLARLANLLNKTEGPVNESIDDSFLDLCTYCALWASYRRENLKGNISPTQQISHEGQMESIGEQLESPNECICKFGHMHINPTHAKNCSEGVSIISFPPPEFK